MKRRLSGWQLGTRVSVSLPPAAPASFDLLLARLGIKEKDAAGNPAVRAWVKQYYRQRYVPEKVMRAVGVYEDWV